MPLAVGTANWHTADMRALNLIFTWVACWLAAPLTHAETPTMPPAAAVGFYDLTLTSLQGTPLPLAEFKGQVVLVVNTASQCGFTGQYKGLQALYSQYKDQGLVVLGVPSNDFGNQEPGTAADIAQFCELNYGVTFPLTEKQAVTGSAVGPLFAWLRQQAGALGAPKWNFYKYLIGRDGQFIDWFASTTTPESEKIQKAVQAALAVK